MAARQACVLAYRGQLKEAKSLTRRAVLLAEEANQKDRAALYLAGLATREALFGNSEDAKNAAGSAIKLSKDRDVLYGAAFAFAWTGTEPQATTIVHDLEKHFPEDTFVNGIYLPTLRAILARTHHDSSRADELLHTTAQYEMSVPGTWFGFFGMMYPTYVRGMAYLDAHEADKAAAEFKKIVEHRGFVASDPMGALASLQLARSLSMQGNAGAAESEYRKIRAIWKGADQDAPVIRQAKLESVR